MACFSRGRSAVERAAGFAADAAFQERHFRLSRFTLTPLVRDANYTDNVAPFLIE
jgi:hypothetical protein